MFTLHEALQAVEGRKEFVVKRYRERLVVVNYLITLPDSFDGIRQEFRGIVFDDKTQEIISLPFHKFYCLNQREHTQYNLLKDLKGVAYEKADGSLIHTFLDPNTNEIVGSTRMSCETPQAVQATKFARKNKQVWQLIEENIEAGYTPLFEYVSPNNQVVVAYPCERLVYLNSRNRKTGEYKFDERFPDKVQKYDLTLAEAIEKSATLQEYEGWVFHLENGLWVKLKTPWYLTKHHTVDVLMKPMYFLCEISLDWKMDDFLQDVPNSYRQKLRDLDKKVHEDYLEFRQNLLTIDNSIKNKTSTRKDYAIYAKTHYKEYFTGLMMAYEDKDPYNFIKKVLMERYREEYPNKCFSEMEVDA